MNHWRAFDRKFFVNHQEKLLWLLNTPVIGRWFRYCMRIRGRERFIAILPHATFWEKDGKIVADFRTHPKYSKRLYHSFLYLWWVLHVFDWAIADRFIPALSFGFATLTKYPDPDPEVNTVDGKVEHWTAEEGVAWATMRAQAGNGANDSATTCFVGSIWGGTTEPNFQGIARSIFLFDTSAIGSGASISSATMSLYGTDKTDTLTTTPTFNIYTSAPASNTSLASGDFDSLGSTGQATSITYSSWDTAAYNDFTLNSTGLSNISKSGITKFGGREATYDAGASTPVWSNWGEAYAKCYTADQTGTANDPKLAVTYTAQWTSSARIIAILRSDGTSG